MSMMTWTGFQFVVKEMPDGSAWVGVEEAAAPDRHYPAAFVPLKLNGRASYSEAREIADFINRKLHLLQVPGALPGAMVA